MPMMAVLEYAPHVPWYPLGRFVRRAVWTGVAVVLGLTAAIMWPSVG